MHISNLDSFERDLSVAIIGASGGIGRALVNICESLPAIKTIYAFSRTEIDTCSSNVKWTYIDIINEQSIIHAAEKICETVDIIIIATGTLHGDGMMPEKSVRDLNFGAFEENFRINTIGPALVMKHFLPFLPKAKKSVLATLSARVGSISDNYLGGWYSYRASKAALNMVIKNVAIESARKNKNAIIIGLHPGTVDTELSAPFKKHVQHDVFSPGQAASYLLDIINMVTEKESGTLIAWNKERIPE